MHGVNMQPSNAALGPGVLFSPVTAAASSSSSSFDLTKKKSPAKDLSLQIPPSTQQPLCMCIRVHEYVCMCVRVHARGVQQTCCEILPSTGLIFGRKSSERGPDRQHGGSLKASRTPVAQLRDTRNNCRRR